MSRSIDPIPVRFKAGTKPFCLRPGSHRLDESADGHSLAGCSPAWPTSASPAAFIVGLQGTICLSTLSFFRRTPSLDFNAASRQTINFQGGPNQMIEVGQAGRSNSMSGILDIWGNGRSYPGIFAEGSICIAAGKREPSDQGGRISVTAVTPLAIINFQRHASNCSTEGVQVRTKKSRIYENFTCGRDQLYLHR